MQSRKNLENKILPTLEPTEGGASMSKNICRPIMINNVKRWISANTEQEYAEKLIAMGGGIPQSESISKHSFNEWTQEYYDAFVAHKSDSERTTNDITLERMMKLHIFPVFEGVNVEDITAAHVQKMINTMEGTKESKKKPLQLVRRALDYAVEQKLIQFNPAKSSSVKLTGKKSKETIPYTVDEMKYFVSHLSDIKSASDRNWLALMTSNPLRLEEVLGIKGEDIDFGTGQLFIHRTVTHSDRNQPCVKEETKTEKSTRVLTVAESTLKLLSPVAKDKWLIGGEQPLSYTAVKRMCTRIAREICSPVAIVPRRFRATCATDVYEKTHDLKLLQQAGGWASPTIPLKHYAKGRQTTQAASVALASLYQ